MALSTAANMCKKLPSDAADYVMEAVPLLTNLLQYHDSKVLECHIDDDKFMVNCFPSSSSTFCYVCRCWSMLLFV